MFFCLVHIRKLQNSIVGQKRKIQLTISWTVSQFLNKKLKRSCTILASLQNKSFSKNIQAIPQRSAKDGTLFPNQEESKCF